MSAQAHETPCVNVVRGWSVAILAGILVGFALPVGLCVPDDPPARYQPRIVHAEDDPGWDCRTMGNRICGPTQAP